MLIIDPRRNPIVEGLAPLTGMQWDTVAVNTEVSMLQLPELIEQVVKQLELTSVRNMGAVQILDWSPGFLAC